MKSLQECFESAKSSMEMEGFTFTKEEEELLLKKARGEISDQEFKNAVLAMIQKKEKGK